MEKNKTLTNLTQGMGLKSHVHASPNTVYRFSSFEMFKRVIASCHKLAESYVARTTYKQHFLNLFLRIFKSIFVNFKIFILVFNHTCIVGFTVHIFGRLRTLHEFLHESLKNIIFSCADIYVFRHNFYIAFFNYKPGMMNNTF